MISEDIMRTQNTLRNISFALFGQIFGIGISFISRIFFIRFLSVEYLGVNGLFTNILFVPFKTSSKTTIQMLPLIMSLTPCLVIHFDGMQAMAMQPTEIILNFMPYCGGASSC